MTEENKVHCCQCGKTIIGKDWGHYGPSGRWYSECGECSKIYCGQCGKMIAVETEEEVQIKCTGKYDGKKCGAVNNINKLTGKQTTTITHDVSKHHKPDYVTERMLTEKAYYDHTEF